MLFETLMVIAAVLGAGAPAEAQLDAQMEAKKLLERVSGVKVPADHPSISLMKSQIEKGNWYDAAYVAMEHPGFLNVTVKQMALKMSNREESFQVDFNDFAASFIGIVRDGVDARELLTGNFHYRADMDRVPAGITIRAELDAHMVRSNDHYQDLGQIGLDLGGLLVQQPGQMLLQSRTNTLVYNTDPAGVLTSRAFINAHASAGTNRRPVEFTMREFMCVPIEEWADTAASDIRIGRDIDRYPGGDHSKFQVSCKGCHTGMDGFRGAFAKWDWSNDFAFLRSVQLNGDGSVDTGVVGKMNNNNTVFSGGFTTTNDSFVNNARGPANQELLGWRGNAESGYGVKDFGRMVAGSRRFSECMVKRVFDSVCRKNISMKDSAPFIRFYAERFESTGYKLKKLYALVSVTEECVK